MKINRSLLPPSPFVIADSNLTSSNVTEAEYSAYDAGTTYALGDRVRIVSPTAAVTMTIASPAVVTWTAHGLPDDTPVRFTTTGALPTGITAGKVYFVRGSLAATPNVFNVCEKPGGAAINTSGSQSGTHTGFATRHDVYESLVGSNLGNAPALFPLKWGRADSTNRWRMFDNSVSSQTSNVDSIATVHATTGIVDAVALLNIQCASVQITQTDDIDGVVYDRTFTGIADSGIQDWYAYFFEPIVYKTEILATDLYPYADASIAVTLTNTGGTALCGACIPGKVLDAGGTDYGMGLGIQDYSVKQKDTFGNYTILERAFNRRVTMMVFVESGLVDALINTLAEYRATPTVYIGADLYGSSAALGFYKDFNVEVRYPTLSLCSIEIEGLT